MAGGDAGAGASIVARRVVLIACAALFVAACAGSGGGDDRAVSAEVAAPPSTAVDEPAAEVESEPNAEPNPTSEPAPTPGPTGAPVPTPTATPVPVVYDGSFASSIQPILEEKCASCHYDGGPGAFHWNLRNAQDVADTHLLLEDVVTSSYMPPWPASDLSVSFQGDRSLRPDQVQAIVDWVDDGAPIDVEATTTIEQVDGVVRLENPDMILEPLAPYAGDPANRDELRCLVYDGEFDEGGWITGYEFLPDQTAVVHHAVGVVMPPEVRGRVEGRDGQDGRPGWSCLGFDGLRAGDDLILWAPGQEPAIAPEGSGYWVRPGGFIVIQIHYHYEDHAPLDNSAIALEFEPPSAELDSIIARQFAGPVEIPCAEWQSGPLCDRDAAIADAMVRLGPDSVINERVNEFCGVTPADFEQFTDGIVESSCTVSALLLARQDGTAELAQIERIVLHMHELGDRTRLTLNKGMPDERILVDIPDWDFEWQHGYVPVEPIVVEPIDTLTLECSWDRARSRPGLEPAWILWAEGTLDEMCVARLDLR